MNKVTLIGRLTREPEMRKLASGKTVTQLSIATNDYRTGSEKSEFHTIVTWDRLAEICAEFLGKGALVALDGRIQTRQWEDENKLRHWKTEIVASSLEMLSGRRKKDYAAESAAQAFAAQAEAMGFAPVGASSAAADSSDDSTLGEPVDAEGEADDEVLVAA
jgi:single-strand DNA-binding protein